MMTPVPTQARRATRLAVTLLAISACGTPGAVPPPASPEAAVRGFLNAVHANSLQTMSELWGSPRGPARSYMNRQEMEQRLTIIRAYLQHDKFEILESQAAGTALGGARAVQVRLERKGCTPVVPFTVVPYHTGWLVGSIDLAQAGNPERSCAPEKKPAGGTAGRRAGFTR